MKKIELVEIRQVNDALAEMVALFRVELRSYKGIASKPNVEDGREEMKEYLFSPATAVAVPKNIMKPIEIIVFLMVLFSFLIQLSLLFGFHFDESSLNAR